MDSLDAVVKSGKVLYLGISDTPGEFASSSFVLFPIADRNSLFFLSSLRPAWIVAACNTYARDHGKTVFSIYQGRWNVML